MFSVYVLTYGVNGSVSGKGRGSSDSYSYFSTYCGGGGGIGRFYFYYSSSNTIGSGTGSVGTLIMVPKPNGVFTNIFSYNSIDIINIKNKLMIAPYINKFVFLILSWFIIHWYLIVDVFNI